MDNKINSVEKNNKIFIIALIIIVLFLGVIYMLYVLFNKKINNLQAECSKEKNKYIQQIDKLQVKYNKEMNNYVQQVEGLKNSQNNKANIDLKKQEVDLDKNTLIRNGYTKEYDDTDKTVGRKLRFVSPEGKSYLVPGEIADKIDIGNFEWEEMITSRIMPIDQNNNNLIYLSTSMDQFPEVINHIYSYNLVTEELKELYSESSDNNSQMTDSEGRELITAGISDNKLILLADDPRDSPGPCFRDWYSFQDYFLYLDLNNTDKLEKYNVPQSIINEAKKEADKCINSLQ